MTTILSKDLPDDVVEDILSRLPVKILMRFRCVCRLWDSKITHASFITKHLNRASSFNNDDCLQYLSVDSSGRQVWRLLSEQKHVPNVKLEIPFDSLAKSCSLVGTFNGLACLSDWKDFGRTLCLWNPSIRRSKPLTSSSSTFPSAQLADHKNYVVLGYGFHSQTNDYKIVRILYTRELSPQVEVYSLNADSWRRIEASVPCHASHQQSNAFFNGSVHWVASRSKADWNRRNMAMSFDIGCEVFGELMLPDYYGREVGRVDLKLAVLKELLSLCVCFEGSGRCCIWIMSEYGVVESWTKRFNIALPNGRIQRPFGFTKNSVILVLTGSKKLISYDLGSKRCKYHRIHIAPYTSNVFPYMETLVLL